MHLNYTQQFLKHYTKRIANNKSLLIKFHERVTLLLTNPQSPLLRVHKLTGTKKNLYAFSITGDVRVVYHQDGEIILFMDIGTHNQVY